MLIENARLYDDIAGAFRVRHIMTPIEGATWVPISDTVKAAVEKLESHRFDRGPVKENEDGEVVGIFECESAENEAAQFVSGAMRQLTPENTVCADAALEDLPSWLNHCSFQIVLAKMRTVGLVNIADLNKAPMRALLFLHVADAERKLAELIRRHYERDEDWLTHVSDPGHKAQMIRWRDKTRQAGVDVGLLEFAYLEDLLDVISVKPIICPIRFLLEWDICTYKCEIKELRNSACHAVKPVLWMTEELPTLVERFARLHNLIDAADKLLGGAQA